MDMFPVLVAAIGLIVGVLYILHSNGFKRSKGESIPEEHEKPLESEINPFADDLESLIDIQLETLHKQIELLAAQYKAETDNNKKVTILNKLTTAQNKLIRLTRQNYDNWKGSG